MQVVALTATADAVTRADIAAQLFRRPPRILVHSFDRPNIALRFAAKDKPRLQIAELLESHQGDSGIVYAASRDRAESLAVSLGKRGHRTLPYHAGLERDVRSRHQDAFLQEDGVVIVATIAFGMGINKPDVRFVAHADMPSGIESYYQEIGRAGRDGLPADTLTLYGLDDMVFRRRQIGAKALSDEQRRIELKRLSAMLDLCEAALCRRQALLAYFGEETGPCGTCDLCTDQAKLYDGTIDAQKALSAVARTGQRFGAAHLADLLRGEATDAIARHGHDRLKRSASAGSAAGAPGWRRYASSSPPARWPRRARSMADFASPRRARRSLSDAKRSRCVRRSSRFPAGVSGARATPSAWLAATGWTRGQRFSSGCGSCASPLPRPKASPPS